MLTKAAERDVDAARGPVSSSVVSGRAAMSGHLARLGSCCRSCGGIGSVRLDDASSERRRPRACSGRFRRVRHRHAVGMEPCRAVRGHCCAALVALAGTLEPGRASNWGRVAVVGVTASVAVAAALQAVDGVALKSMVDRWAAAIGQEQRIAFEAALAVRQIEIGLASLVSILFGLTWSLYGIAVLRSSRYPNWLGAVGLAGGLGTVSGGIVQASTGFSGLAMTISMTASSLLLIRMISIAVHMWRLAPRLETDG